ncbi:HTH_XRE domain containing protein [uncultured Caudovirales phage]|uniref:HTH_XRE domain containing protein n=1 Tax=uncultured Caudovirales phage TaxID=2100421 RepID=A0A6J5MIV8_9CAUD|nr:HTH_XRE domain containing protein [uncultured Caudovirales phage]
MAKRTVRQHIRCYLAERDISAAQLARELGIDGSHLSLIVNGLRTPSLEVALRLSEMCEMDIRLFAPKATRTK